MAHSKKVGGASSAPDCCSALDRPAHAVDAPAQGVRADFFVVDDESLFEAFEVRRGVARRAVACRAQAAMDHRGDRALAVGPGNDDRREGTFGMIERGAQPRDVLEAELHAQPLEAEQVVERVRVQLLAVTTAGPGQPRLRPERQDAA